jgi:lysyl-tRNA synthetase class 2
MNDKNDQKQQRLLKLQALKALGIDPYGQRFEVSHTAKALIERYGSLKAQDLEAEPIACRLAGRIMSLRRFGKASFSHLQDATGRIQVYFKKDVLGDQAFALFELLDLGDLIGIGGHLFKTKTGELTVQVTQLNLLAKALRPLPEKWHGLTDVEIRYRQRYLDLITNPEARQVFITRSLIIQAVRAFLDQEGFLEVETPMMQSIPGGAAARPFVTHHHALGIDLYLRIAPELYLKRLIVGGLDRVYEINRNFRNEGISTVHNPEFTMLEFYMAYADYRDLMTFTERLLGSVAQRVLGTLNSAYQGQTIDLTPPWKRVDFIGSILAKHRLDPKDLEDSKKVVALARHLKLPVKEDESSGKILQKIFEATIEPTLISPTFIMDYPTDISPLARRKPDQPSLTERFELFIGGLEIANAFSELNDPFDQRDRFSDQVRQRAAGDLEAHPMDEDYLRALEHGMPPTAGEGIGIDRLVMLLTNQTSIRDVILFPHLRPEKS